MIGEQKSTDVVCKKGNFSDILAVFRALRLPLNSYIYGRELEDRHSRTEGRGSRDERGFSRWGEGQGKSKRMRK